MPNIATVLKDEITRLARKEVKVQVAGLKKANTQYRRDIAELKRQIRDVTKQTAFLQGQERKRIKTPSAAAETQGLRFSARWLKTHRDRLQLSAEDYALLVGVSSQTIYNWESGRSKPRQQQLAALAAIRGLGKREAWNRLEA